MVGFLIGLGRGLSGEGRGDGVGVEGVIRCYDTDILGLPS